MAVATLIVRVPQAAITRVLHDVGTQNLPRTVTERRFSADHVLHVASRERLYDFEAVVVGSFKLKGINHLLLASGDILALEPTDD